MIIVNYSSSNNWYTRGQERIKIEMPKYGYDGEFKFFKDTLPKGSPSHIKSPYGFKVYAIQEGLDSGHNLVWWMDSSIYPVKDISRAVNLCLEQGYLFEDSGHNIGNWTNDRTLDYFGISRDEAMGIPMYSAGFTALNFNFNICNQFFNDWKKSCELGYFKGDWSNNKNSESLDPRCLGHRHDMSCASIIAYKLGMKLAKGGDFLSYVGDAYGTPNESAIFHLQPC
jgi:hypothetical protein